LAASPQVKSNGRPPRILDQIIEMMFPLTALCRFNFDPRLFAIESVHNSKYKSGSDRDSDSPSYKGGRCGGSNNKSCNRELVWRDARLAKKRDDAGFDRRMDIGWQVERSFLR